MDYENAWLNYDESPATASWRNTQQYPSLYFPDSYVPANAGSPFPNLQWPGSPVHSGFVHYPPASPISSDANGNGVCHSPCQHFECLMHNDSQIYKNCHPHCNASEEGGIIYDRPPGCLQSKAICPQSCMMRQNMKIKPMKQNIRRKKKQPTQTKSKSGDSCSSVSQVISFKDGGNISVQNFSNNMANISNCELSNQESSMARNDNAKCNSSKILDGCHSERVHLHNSTNHCEFQTMTNYSQPDGLDKSTSVITDSRLNVENFYIQGQTMLNCTSEDTNMNVFNIAEGLMAQQESNLPSNNSEERSEKLSTELCGNTNYEILNGSENTTDTEYLNLQSIILGKDENGEDIFVLFSAPEGDQENSVDSAVNAQSISSTENNLDVMHNVELQTSQGTATTQNESESAFVSGIDDYACEETVGTSPNKNFNSNKVKRKGKRSSVKNQSKQKITKKKELIKNDFTAEATSSKDELFQNYNRNKARNSHPPRFKIKYKNKANIKNKQNWKRHLQWKFKETPFSDLQKAYFHQFMREFEIKHKEINDDDLQKMLKFILNEVGGSVMQSIYQTFHALIRTYNKRSKCINTATKCNGAL